MAHKLGDLAKKIGAELIGDPNISIEGIGSIPKATPGQITFFSDTRYQKQLIDTRASAVVMRHEDTALCELPKLACDNPYVAFAILSQIFVQIPLPKWLVHPAAVVADDCKLGKDVSIGPGTFIDYGVTIGDGCVIGPNCVIGRHCKIGNQCRLNSNVVLEHDVCLGNNGLIHSGAVIGSDGFGFADNKKGEWLKIFHKGRVIIGNHVEIGSNTTIDRGAVDDTEIGEGVKIDNQVQIAHNVCIGAYTMIAGCVGVAGSTTIGSHCCIGGAAGIGDHLKICDHVIIAGMTTVAASIDKPGFYASSTPIEPHNKWRRTSVQIRRLDSFVKSVMKRLQQLEK